MKRLILFFSCFVFFTACNEKPVIVPQFEPPVSSRVVLLEELTGVECQNCPQGSAIAESLAESVFPGQVIVVGVHGGFLTDMLANSTYSFKNQDAIDLELYLKPWQGKPCASINRILFEGEDLLANNKPGEWQGLVNDVLQQPHQVEVVFSHEFDAVSGELTVNVGIAPLEDISQGEFRLTVMLTESHMIDPQKNGSEIEEDYEHNHVLRDILTNFDGDVIGNSLSKGTNLSRTITANIQEVVDGEWIPENMSIVVALANTGGTGKNVMQAAEAHLVE